MHDVNDENDSMLDRNLRTVGAQLELPADPTPGQIAGWKQPLRAMPARRSTTRRWLGWAGGGAAIAASLAVAAALHLSAGQNKVQAASVFAGLRQAMSNAFRISFDNIGDHALVASGEIVVVCAPEGQLASGDAPDAVHIQARIQADEAAGELAGLDATVELAITAEHKWAYLRTGTLPEAFKQKHLAATWVEGMARDGMLIRLDDLLNKQAQLTAGVTKPQAPDEASEQPDASERRAVVFGIKLGGKSEPDEPADQQLAQLQQRAITTGSGINLALSQDDEVGQLIGKLVSGQATGDELAKLVTVIEETAGKVDIAEVEPGLHLLTASEFKQEPDANSPLDDDAVLEIAYREGAGVEHATLKHVGPGDGSVRFEGIAITADDERFSDERFANDGTTRLVSPAALLPLIGAWALESGFDGSDASE